MPQLLLISSTGDDEMKTKLEARANAFDPQVWWEQRVLTLEEIAISSTTTTEREVGSARARLHNPYEGLCYARQLNETVEEFLERLPPATTRQSHKIPWIFIANPHIPS